MTNELFKRIITSMVLLTFLYIMYFNIFFLLIGLILLTFIVWFEFNILILKVFKFEKKPNYLFKFLIHSGAFLYLGLFSYIFWTYLISDDKIFFLFLVGICIVTDIGGLIFGKFFKGKKLTKISPNKTISGLIGSFIGLIIMTSTTCNYKNFI